MEIETITGHLRHIAEKESITIDEASLVSIAKKADGSMRDSQSIFDQVVSFCGTAITIADVSAALHLIDLDFYFLLSDAVRTHDIPQMFRLARQVVQRGYDLQECLVGLLEHFRNILTVISTGGTDLIEASAADCARYRDEAALFTKADVLRIMTMIASGEAVLRQNPPQPRVRFEFTLVQLAGMDSAVDLGKVIASVTGGTAARTNVPTSPAAGMVGGVAATRPMPVRIGTPVIVKAPQAPVSSLTSGNLAMRWDSLLQTLPEHLSFVRDAVRQSMLTVDFTDVGIVLRPHAEVVYHNLANSTAALKAHLAETYGAPLGVQLIEPRRAAAARTAPVQPAAQDGAPSAPTVASVPSVTDDMLPIEKTIVELFKARRASTPGS
jgi:DNA polymerase-3 subunit gamma/tau